VIRTGNSHQLRPKGTLVHAWPNVPFKQHSWTASSRTLSGQLVLVTVHNIIMNHQTDTPATPSFFTKAYNRWARYHHLPNVLKYSIQPMAISARPIPLLLTWHWAGRRYTTIGRPQKHKSEQLGGLIPIEPLVKTSYWRWWLVSHWWLGSGLQHRAKGLKGGRNGPRPTSLGPESLLKA